MPAPSSLSILADQLPDHGTLYRPAGEGPFPAVLILHGSEGGWAGWSHMTAVLLAAHGFLTYPHAYSRGGDIWSAGSIRAVPLDDTQRALRALRACDHCSGKVGIYGISRGGEHALLITALMMRDGEPDPPDAVAAHSPADVICGAFDAKTWGDPSDPGWKVWDPAERSWTWRGRSDDLKPTTPIEIERYPGPVMLSHGTEDQVWDVAMTRRLEERLKAAGRSPEVHYYEGEGHGLMGNAENLQNQRLITFMHRHLKA